jgi:hypothetical protein
MHDCLFLITYTTNVIKLFYKIEKAIIVNYLFSANIVVINTLIL